MTSHSNVFFENIARKRKKNCLWKCKCMKMIKYDMKLRTKMEQKRNQKWIRRLVKPLSVTTNVVGLQTDDVSHMGQNSSADVARVVGLQTDAVVVTETRFSFHVMSLSIENTQKIRGSRRKTYSNNITSHNNITALSSGALSIAWILQCNIA